MVICMLLFCCFFVLCSNKENHYCRLSNCVLYCCRAYQSQESEDNVCRPLSGKLGCLEFANLSYLAYFSFIWLVFFINKHAGISRSLLEWLQLK